MNRFYKLDFQTLSLHSSILREILYKKGQLVVGAKIDVDPHSFITFLQATTGHFPSSERFKKNIIHTSYFDNIIDCTTKLLDDLLIMGAKPFYEFYLSEIRKKIMILPSLIAEGYALSIFEHYSNQPTPDMNSMVSSFMKNVKLIQISEEFRSLSLSW